MTSPDPADELVALLHNLDKELYSSSPTSETQFDSGVAILELARESDVSFFGSYVGDDDATPAPYYHRGIQKMLAAFLQKSDLRSDISTHSSSPQLQEWSRRCIQQAGLLSQLAHLVDLTREGLFTVVKSGPRRFDFQPVADTVDREAFDVRDQSWVRDFVKKTDRERKRLAREQPAILARMKRLVFPLHSHLTGYSSDDQIDRYFDRLGVAWGRALDGQWELDGESTIGGYPFTYYRAAVARMCGRALRHFHFADQLLGIYPQMCRHDLTSLCLPRRKWIKYFRQCLSVDRATADDLLRSLTLDKEYCETFVSIPGAPIPPLIQINSEAVLMSHRGCLDAPFWFLLRKLRHEHRRDWDGIVELRESKFRKDLYTLFRARQILVCEHRVRVRKVGREVTDIDAVAFDPADGTLALFQLKWQDPFGHSMRERRSKANNFVLKANEWAESVDCWISALDRRDLMRYLRLDDGTERTVVKRIELIVLGRHHGSFSNAPKATDLAAWGSWPQLCRLANDWLQHPDQPLGDLIEILRAEQSRQDSPRQFSPGVAHVGELEIRLLDPAM